MKPPPKGPFVTKEGRAIVIDNGIEKEYLIGGDMGDRCHYPAPDIEGHAYSDCAFTKDHAGMHITLWGFGWF